MASSITIKQGATFLLHGVLTQDDGSAVDVTDVQLSCQLNDTMGNAVAQLSGVPTAPTEGQFDLLVASALTKAWPIGQLTGDVLYVQDGVVITSDSFAVVVQPAVTPAP